MRYLVGIDDTDTKDTRGTGFHARELAAGIIEAQLGQVLGITRHQNYVHPDIPYTSQNSSACLAIATEQPEELKKFCRTYLLEIAPVGSDVGLSMVAENAVSEDIIKWGFRAKVEVLFQEEARMLAKKNDVFLEGLTGTFDGIIGALGAVGLRKSGVDGRFIWLKQKRELRDLSAGFVGADALREDFGIQQILKVSGEAWEEDQEIFVHEWFRPVLKNNKVTLIVEKHFDDGKYFWKTASKDYIRANS